MKPSPTWTAEPSASRGSRQARSGPHSPFGVSLTGSAYLSSQLCDRVTIPPKRHAPTAEESSLLESIFVRIRGRGGGDGDGRPYGYRRVRRTRAAGAVREGGADFLARFLAGMPDKSNRPPSLPPNASEKEPAVWNASWTMVRPTTGRSEFMRTFLEQPEAAEAQPFFEEGCRSDRLTLRPHQQAVRQSTGAEGLRLPSAKTRRMSASIESSTVGTIREVPAGFTCPLGKRVKTETPEPGLVNRVGKNCGIFATHGVSQEKRWSVSSLNLGWSATSAQRRTTFQGLRGSTCSRYTTQGRQTPTRPKKQ